MPWSMSRAAADLTWCQGSVRERLIHALVYGLDEFVVADAEQARLDSERTLQVIEGPLTEGMDVVGELLGAGKMLLP